MKQASLKKNFIMNTILTMSSFVFPLITFPYVTRVLMPVGTGKVAFATSLIAYFNVFAQLGIPTYGVRACARVRDDKGNLTKTAQELIIINLVMSGIAYACLFAALLFVPRLYSDRLLYLIVSVTILLNAIGMEWLYKALEKYSYITIRSISFKIVALIAMFLLIHEADDYVIYGGVSVLAASASNIANFIHSRKYIDWKLTGSYDFRRHMKPIGIFFAMACATTIYTNLDELMLGFMAGDVAVGYYDAATKIKKVLVGVVTSLGVVVLPRASYYIEKGMIEEFWSVSKKALHFIILMATSLLLFFTFFSEEVIYVLAGRAYDGAIIPMKVLMPTLLFIGLTNIMGIQMMVPLGREKDVLYSVTIGALVDAALNFLLIPKLGATGAAIGTFFAEAAVLIYQLVVLREQVVNMFRSIKYWKIVVALVLAVIVSNWIHAANLSPFITLLIGATLFFLLYGITLIVTKEELTIELLYKSFLKNKSK